MPIVFALTLLAGSATAQEREWTMDTNNANEVFMTYGVPFTDDVGLSLWCKIGSKELRLFVPKSGWPEKKSPKTVKITLTAGKVKSRVRAKLQTDLASNSLSVEAIIPTKDPVVKALTDTEHLDINTGKKTVIVPMYNAEPASLLKLCEGK
jgi:hypothetical protein